MKNADKLLEDAKKSSEGLNFEKIFKLNIPENSRFNKLYAVRAELSENVMGIYEGIMFLPLKGEFNLDGNVLKLKSNEELSSYKKMDYKLIENPVSLGDEVDIATGNIHPKKIVNAEDEIEYQGIKQFVLVRPDTKNSESKNARHWGPYYGENLKDGDNEKDFYVYSCEDDEKKSYIPKYAFYPRPDENVEILEDDDELFKDINDDMGKEVLKDGIKYIGLTKAFDNFLKSVYLR